MRHKATLLILAISFHFVTPAQGIRPNFILILTDDHGWTSTSTPMDQRLEISRSDLFETPNIDRLANMGMRFSHGYSPAAICTPARRSILFGQNAVRQGDEEGFEARYHPDNHQYLTIPLMLKEIDAAYRTAHFGKWHMQGNFTPEDVGYDESDGDTRNADGDMFEYKKDKWMKTFFTDDPKHVNRITDRGINFIKRSVTNDHPFFLQLSHYATHVDIQTTEEAYEKYSDKPKGIAHNHPGYAGMLDHLDKGIGKLLDYVEQQGILNNTYIILLADNGGVEFIPPSGNKLRHPDTHGMKQRNYPLRGGKWVLFEGGIRVPFMISGPDVPAGSQSDVPVIGYDILPTIAEMAGYDQVMPEYVDGGSIRQLFKDGTGKVKRNNEALIFHRYVGYYPHSAIIMEDYKLIKYWKSSPWHDFGVELYNIKNDVGELKDLSAKMPEKTKIMETALLDYFKSVNNELLTDLKRLEKAKADN